MGNPKRKRSKAQSRSNAAHWKLEAPATLKCPRSHSPKLPHQACPRCGYYRDRQVVTVAEAGTKR